MLKITLPLSVEELHSRSAREHRRCVISPRISIALRYFIKVSNISQRQDMAIPEYVKSQIYSDISVLGLVFLYTGRACARETKTTEDPSLRFGVMAIFPYRCWFPFYRLHKIMWSDTIETSAVIDQVWQCRVAGGTTPAAHKRKSKLPSIIVEHIPKNVKPNVWRRRSGKFLQNMRLAARMEGDCLLILTGDRNILMNWDMRANQHSHQQ